ncbi:hypothetical protein CRG98_012347 [Punica granatum]|uniref:Uncharacterized protein n=1 Tax=Punica granatum TaxID=22663 RepID=A0A2I0KFI8_PUNGR|nr:hypothetical protein CRG98_012347 [Punica granatum]
MSISFSSDQLQLPVHSRRSGVSLNSCLRPKVLQVMVRSQPKQPGKTRVHPKWLMKGSPVIVGHPMAMGSSGFHRVDHENCSGKAVNKHASRQTGSSPNPQSMSPTESPSCTDPNVVLVGARMLGLGVFSVPGMRDGHA